MLADLQLAEQQLTAIKQQVAQRHYAEATPLIVNWQQLLQNLFSQATALDPESRQQLQQLSEEFLTLLSALNTERQQIKDSISQMAAVKSGNKISKTYQIE